MKMLMVLSVIVIILASPLWIALLVLSVPRRWWIIDVVLCALQAGIVYFVWWFLWGGGIGGEAHTSVSWKWLGLAGCLPVVIAVLKQVIRNTASVN